MRLLVQIIYLRAQFSDHSIKMIYVDNTVEYTSQAFDTYCMLIDIIVKYLVTHVHTQNSLAESFIKRL